MKYLLKLVAEQINKISKSIGKVLIFHEIRYNIEYPDEFRDEVTEDQQPVKETVLFSEEKVYNYDQEDVSNNRLSRSMESWSHNQENIDEFLKGSNNSFFNNESSFKESESNGNIHPEIS